VYCLAKVATGTAAGTYYARGAEGSTCGTDPAQSPYEDTADGWKA
jgi:hypothetical protein